MNENFPFSMLTAPPARKKASAVEQHLMIHVIETRLCGPSKSSDFKNNRDK